MSQAKAANTRLQNKQKALDQENVDPQSLKRAKTEGTASSKRRESIRFVTTKTSEERKASALAAVKLFFHSCTH